VHKIRAEEFAARILLLVQRRDDRVSDRIGMGTPSRQHSGKDAGGSDRRIALPGTTTKRRVFGVDDRVKCSKCAQDTYLRRRSVHSIDGSAYEIQSFACRACKALTTRIVDADGRLVSAQG
jgi:hypothetical protein